MSSRHKCLVGSKDLADVGIRFEIQVKREKAKRNAHEKTDSSAEALEEHCTNAQSNEGVTGGAREGACLTICLSPRRVNLSSGAS